MKLLPLALSALLLAGSQDDREAQMKRMAEVMAESLAIGRRLKEDPSLKKDKAFMDKAFALQGESLRLLQALTGGDMARADAVTDEVVTKYAPHLADEVYGSRIARNETTIRPFLGAIQKAEDQFRSNDMDGNLINDFWVGDVAGLGFIVPLDYTTGQVRAKSEIVSKNCIWLVELRVADADAAPLDLPTYAYPEKHAEKPQPLAGYLFSMVKKLDDQGKEVAFGMDTDGPKGLGEVHNLDRYAVAAIPAIHGRTGKTTFVATEAKAIWAKDTGGKVPGSFPADPAKAGWTKVD